MWEAGNFGKTITKSFNQELMEIEGDITQHEAQVLLAKFMYHNLGFTYRLLTGSEDLFDFQIIKLKTFLEKDEVLDISSRGFAKCEDSNALVFLSGKGFVPLKCVTKGDRIFAKDRFQTVLNKFDNPVEDGYEITTKKNWSFRGKIGHRTLCLDPDTLNYVYKKVEDLKEGDLLVRYKGNNLGKLTHIIPRFWECKFNHLLKDPEFYYFLGLFVGDGGFTRHKEKVRGLNFTNCEDNILKFWQFFQNKHFPTLSSKIFNDKRSKAKRISLMSPEFANFLIQLGCSNEPYNKKIPAFLYSVNQKFVSLFIKGLFDADGSANFYEKPEKNAVSCIVDLASSYKEIIDFVRMYLFDMGINTGMTSKKGGNTVIQGVKCNGIKSYRIHITGFQNLRLFDKVVGFNSKHKNRNLKEFLNRYQSEEDKYSDLLPIGRYLKSKIKNRKIDGKWLKICPCKSISKYKVNLYKEKRLLDAEMLEKVEKLLDPRTIIEPVKKITEIKVQTVGLTVENEECYWSNGFIHHNTFTGAVFMLLYCIFFPGSEVVVLGPSFKQSKNIFRYALELIDNDESEFLRQIVSKKDLHMRQDEWNLKIGFSTACCLPLGAGGKIRGKRGNLIILDEFFEIPKNIVQSVIMPFGVVRKDSMKQTKFFAYTDKLIKQGLLTEEERQEKVRNLFPNNKLLCLSSASYKFEHLYERFENYVEYITDPRHKNSEKTYAIINLSCDVAPPRLLSRETIEQAKREYSESLFNREYMAQFADDSSGYFKMKKMQECTVEPGHTPIVEIAGDRKAKYILAVDPNYDDSEGSDHFAMSLLKLDEGSEKTFLVHSFALAGVNYDVTTRYFVYLMKYFNIVYIIFDKAGSRAFLEYAHNSAHFKENNIKLEEFDASFDPDNYEESLREARNSYNFEQKKILHTQSFSAHGWIRMANEYLSSSIDHKRMWFAAPASTDQDYARLEKQDIPIGNLTFENQGVDEKYFNDHEKKNAFIEHQDELSKLTKAECALIEITSTPQGHQSFDLPRSLRHQKGPDKTRKDNYTSLLLANWGVKCYKDMIKLPKEEKPKDIMPVMF